LLDDRARTRRSHSISAVTPAEAPGPIGIAAMPTERMGPGSAPLCGLAGMTVEERANADGH